MNGGGADSQTQQWEEALPLLERADAGPFEVAASRVRALPPRARAMPDAWWKQWRSGQREAWHRLAAWRRLGELRDVENGVPNGTPLDRSAERFANFSNGACAVAGPPDLGWLVVCACAEWHHNGGDIVVWGTDGSVPSRMLLDGGAFHDEAYDVQLSPDTSTAVTAVEGRLRAWHVPSGQPLWQIDLDRRDEVEDFPIEESFLRLGFSGDSRRVAVGALTDGVRVVDAATADLVLVVPDGTDNPVALDRDGARLAHATPDGEVVVREVPSGAVVLGHTTGLVKINALAFAPDGTGLVAAGGTADEAPAASLLAIEDDQVSHARLVVPAAAPAGLSAITPFAGVATRAVWGEMGPMVFVSDGGGAVLFDADGRVLWADSLAMAGNFTPDGRILTVIADAIDAIFIEALAG
jgi:hypothetical protein